MSVSYIAPLVEHLTEDSGSKIPVWSITFTPIMFNTFRAETSPWNWQVNPARGKNLPLGIGFFKMKYLLRGEVILRSDWFECQHQLVNRLTRESESWFGIKPVGPSSFLPSLYSCLWFRNGPLGFMMVCIHINWLIL